MPKARKIALILGELVHPRLLFTFTELAKRFEVTAFMLRKPELLACVPQQIKAHLFKRSNEPEAKDHTPGFMRGLEKTLVDQDIIISLELNSVSTLQAARFAQASGKPFLCYCSETELSAYTSYQSLHNFHEFLLAQTTLFLVPTASVRRELQAWSLPPERILELFPRVDTQRFAVNPLKKRKFRTYIGLNEKERVLLFFGALLKENRPELLLKAQKLLEFTGVKPKLFFVGTGSFSQELQYLSYNLGVGASTYFLSQDPEPFLPDLFAASDVLVFPRSFGREHLPVFPYYILEAMACGVLPLVAEQSLEAELVARPSLLWDGESYEGLAFALQQVLGSDQAYVEQQKAMLTQLELRMQAKAQQGQLLDWVEGYFSGRERQLPQRKAPAWQSLALQVKDPHEAAQAVAHIAELLASEPSRNLEEQSRLLALQGEAYKCLSCFEEASQAFEAALQADSKNLTALSGLGFLSWQLHQHSEAMAFFKQGLSLAPNDGRCMLGVGMVYKRVAMTEDALFWMEKSIQASPSLSASSLPLLLQACGDCSNPHLAIGALERVAENLGEDANLMRCLGRLYLKVGQREVGLRILEKYF